MMAHSFAFIHLETSNLGSFAPSKYLANSKLVFVVSSRPPFSLFKANNLEQKEQEKKSL